MHSFNFTLLYILGGFLVVNFALTLINPLPKDNKVSSYLKALILPALSLIVMAFLDTKLNETTMVWFFIIGTWIAVTFIRILRQKKK